jgi:hypothetical protein
MTELRERLIAWFAEENSGFTKPQECPEDWADDLLERVLAELLDEHKRWAEDFGDALVLALQGDYSRVDELAREMRIDIGPGGVPRLQSAAIIKSEGSKP